MVSTRRKLHDVQAEIDKITQRLGEEEPPRPKGIKKPASEYIFQTKKKDVLEKQKQRAKAAQAKATSSISVANNEPQIPTPKYDIS